MGPKTQNKLVVVGSVNVDLICYSPRLPSPGETVIGTSFSKGCGGKGANQCVSAARLGADAYLVAKVGDDVLGREYLESLVRNHVNTTFVSFSTQPTGVAQITVGDDGENFIVIVPGANNELLPAEVDRVALLIKEATVVIVQLEVPLETTMRVLELRQESKGRTIFNVAPAIPELPLEVFRLCDIVCMNESEAQHVTGMTIDCVNDAKSATCKLLGLGCKVVIITMGKDGAVWAERSQKILPEHIAAPAVTTVDSTGAGDMFVGSLAFYLAHFPNLPLREILIRSCELATRSVMKPGTQSSFPMRLELPALLFQTLTPFVRDEDQQSNINSDQPDNSASAKAE